MICRGGSVGAIDFHENVLTVAAAFGLILEKLFEIVVEIEFALVLAGDKIAGGGDGFVEMLGGVTAGIVMTFAVCAGVESHADNHGESGLTRYLSQSLVDMLSMSGHCEAKSRSS